MTSPSPLVEEGRGEAGLETTGQGPISARGRRDRAGEEAAGVDVRPASVEVVDVVDLGHLTDVNHLAGPAECLGIGGEGGDHPAGEVRGLGPARQLTLAVVA